MLSLCPDCRRHVRDEPSCPFCGSVAPRSAAQGAASSHSARMPWRTGRLTRAALVAGALGLAGCDDPPPAPPPTPPGAGEPAPPEPAPPQPPPDYGAMEPAYGAPPEVAPETPPTPPDDPPAAVLYGGPPRAR